MTTIRIQSDREASWVLGRYSRACQQIQAIEDRTRDLRNRAAAFKLDKAAPLAAERDYWQALLEAYHADRLAAACDLAGVDPVHPTADGWKKIKTKTDTHLTGVIRARRIEGSYTVDDADAFRCWLIDQLGPSVSTLAAAANDTVGTLSAALALPLADLVDVRLAYDVAAPRVDDVRFAPIRDDESDLWTVIFTDTGETVAGLLYEPPVVSISATPGDAEVAAVYEPLPEGSTLDPDDWWKAPDASIPTVDITVEVDDHAFASAQ